LYLIGLRRRPLGIKSLVEGATVVVAVVVVFDEEPAFVVVFVVVAASLEKIFF
jgi:hypothetical protein